MDGGNRQLVQQGDSMKNGNDDAPKRQSRLRGGFGRDDDIIVEQSGRELAWPYDFRKRFLDVTSLVEGSCGLFCTPTRDDDDDGWYEGGDDDGDQSTSNYDDDDAWYTRRDLDGSNTEENGISEEDEMDEISRFEEMLLDLLREGPFEVFHELERVEVIFGP